MKVFMIKIRGFIVDLFSILSTTNYLVYIRKGA